MRLDLTQLTGRLWLIHPGAFRPFVLRALSFTDCPSARDVARERRNRLEWAKAAPSRAIASTGNSLREELAAPVGKRLNAVKGRVGVVPVYGPVAQRMSAEVMKAGGTTTEEVAAALDALLNDKACDAVVLDVDSPGGSSYGVEELSDKIYNARSQKPVYAIANSMACSAAYWIATSASQMFCTPGGDVGSVGCYLMHVDQSGQNENEGLSVSFISAGRYKTAGNPHEPLDKETTDYLQGQVDATAGKFQDALRRNRDVSIGQVRTGFGQGRVVNADQALTANMVDRVMSLDDLMMRLTGNAVQSAGRRTAAGAGVEVLRLRHEYERRKTALLLPGKMVGANLTHDSETADSEPKWSTVDKTKLPRVAFAEQGDADEKSSWGFPHHFVSGGKIDEDTGVYNSGTLYLHQEGLNAAWSAAQGGRSGEKADAKVIAHLQAHRKALGLDEEKE